MDWEKMDAKVWRFQKSSKVQAFVVALQIIILCALRVPE